MPKKLTQTQERLEAIYKHRGKKTLAEIWDDDRELDPKRVSQITKQPSPTQ